MSTELLIAIIVTVVGASTPILIAALGELVVEKSGVLNLGVEGMMLVGGDHRLCRHLHHRQSLPRDSLRGGGGGAWRPSMIFGFLTLSLSANQTATGAGADHFRHRVFGTGGGRAIRARPVGRCWGRCFRRNWRATRSGACCSAIRRWSYFSLIMVVAVWFFLKRTRAGLILRAVGENDLSAHSIGYSVIGVRYAAVAFGGAMAGIAGGLFSRCC
jgi:ABC-type uncharacterized transport system permease subunit